MRGKEGPAEGGKDPRGAGGINKGGYETKSNINICFGRLF